MITRRKRILAAVAVACLAVPIGFAFWSVYTEPRYEGKRLSEWLVDLGNPESRGVAKEAIHFIGTNALPTLIDDLSAVDPAWKQKLVTWSTNRSWFPIKFSTPEERRLRAVLACQALGLLAKPAIAGLKEAFHTGSDPLCDSAGRALNGIGEEGQDVLIEAFFSTNSFVRNRAILEIRYPLMTPMKAKEPLIQLSKTNASVEGLCRMAIAMTTLSVSHNIKYRVDELNAPNPINRSFSAFQLGKWGAEASSAIPALEKALQHPDAEFRVEVRNALFKIRTAMAAEESQP